MEKLHAMIDLETLGNGPNAAVLQIGACHFFPEVSAIGESLSFNVDLDSELKAGFEVDASTLYWWLGQTKEAQESVASTQDQLHTNVAFMRLNEFLAECSNIWSHATFDFPIVMNHLRKLGIHPRFSFRAARDIRTLIYLAGGVDFKKYEKVGIPHTALGDCMYQTRYVMDCLNILEGETK